MSATTNQIIAMLFPLLAVVITGALTLIARKPWTRKRKEHNLAAADLVVGHPEVDTALLSLREADRLIEDVRRSLLRAVK